MAKIGRVGQFWVGIGWIFWLVSVIYEEFIAMFLMIWPVLIHLPPIFQFKPILSFGWPNFDQNLTILFRIGWFLDSQSPILAVDEFWSILIWIWSIFWSISTNISPFGSQSDDQIWLLVDIWWRNDQYLVNIHQFITIWKSIRCIFQ